MPARAAAPSRPRFDVWGCRGSRNLAPSVSRLANRTSCYSLAVGRELVVFDAGRGLAALGHALRTQAGLRGVDRIHLLVTHAHMDHWEGLKDVEWFWRFGNGLEVWLYGTAEALGTIRRGFEPPAYVPLELLAQGTVRSLSWETLQAGADRPLAGGRLRAFALNHYSGAAETRRDLDTLGFRLELPRGPVVAYVSDHEPTPATWPTEMAIVSGAHLVVYDAHFPDLQSHRHGHGSQEHAALVARAHAGTLVLAGHHGPAFDDEALLASFRRFGRGLRNLRLAQEGARWDWDGRRFRPGRPAPSPR
jgi:phosphoribosyl 1,2-cyclic phosphodiesterase